MLINLYLLIMIFQKEILLEPKKRGFHLITNDVISQLPNSTGIVNIFIKHTSASLTINENADPSVRFDFETHFNKMVSENENYFTHNMNLNGQQQKQYNEDINTIWDDIKDFIRLHYISPRQDTTFWKDVSNTKMSDTLKTKLDIWKGRMPRYADYGRHNFYDLGNTLWYQILLGMNLLDKNIAENELKSFDLYDYAEQCYRLTLDGDKKVFNELISNNKYYGK